ncbi:hypothetical protein niasHT_031096 [Heterodera trifolii]|uniref:MATH domain-containing protein n=1 Tax=Heterodera trifolii TaxID=157864 RepID=A0ABD2IV75_9BILA
MSKAAIAGLKLMLSTGEYADVHFLVGDGDAKEHASDVFEAMFRFDANKELGEKASTNSPVVEVPDVEATAFKVMLSFIYMEDLSELNGDNAIAALYDAKKYNIPDLVLPSLQIPISELRNVFFAFAQARLFDLEDYVNDCLAYIDKNADILLKSDAFLQIDEKLLSENRRQMLGPALFKIRFPLFSQKEFSEKIVPSGILTTNEVIAVEQFHTNQNFCGISDGLLYPVQFPSHERIWTFGTLLLDIEEVSEFAGEEIGSMRHIENVYINGLSWKIGAQIRMKWRSTDNEKCLGIYLLCTEPKEGFPNFISFAELMDPSNGFYNREEDKVTLAIDITVKNGNIDKIILDQSKSKGKLFMEIEKMSEFAREVFLSERKSETVHIKGLPWKILAQIQKKIESTDNEKCKDKVTLAIDITTSDEPKVDKCIISDPSKSNGTISMEIEKVSEFAREVFLSERKSETVTYKGLPWKILAQINPSKKGSVKCLGFFLSSVAPNEENWSCECSGVIRIFSQKNDVTDLRREFDAHVINNEDDDWGFSEFITFADLIDPEKGFYNESEDKVTVAIDFAVEEAKNDKS